MVVTVGVLDDQQYEDAVVAGLRARLRAVARQSAEPLEKVLGPASALAERVAAVVPTPSPFAAVVGPVFRPASLARVAGCSRQAVSEMVRTRRVLALRTSDGVQVIPSFQLDDSHRPIRGLNAILREFDAEAVDGWTLASWLQAPQPGLDGESVIEHLRQGREVAVAVAAAQAAQRRWSQ